MKPYSQDLRSRVLTSAKTGKTTHASIAATYRVSVSTVEKWVRRKRETGQETALPPRRGRSRTLRDCAPFIRAEVKQQPDSTLAELCTRLAEAKGVKASPGMMCRELRHLDLRRKKVVA